MPLEADESRIGEHRGRSKHKMSESNPQSPSKTPQKHRKLIPSIPKFLSPTKKKGSLDSTAGQRARGIQKDPGSRHQHGTTPYPSNTARQGRSTTDDRNRSPTPNPNTRGHIENQHHVTLLGSDTTEDVFSGRPEPVETITIESIDEDLEEDNDDQMLGDHDDTIQYIPNNSWNSIQSLEGPQALKRAIDEALGCAHRLKTDHQDIPRMTIEKTRQLLNLLTGEPNYQPEKMVKALETTQKIAE
ncbi:uncharacterized protein BT62DRAFT_1002443 [Guyanagaster necrorhizus]|uniref:Uncharacterized protein n=1 Tax=Guyanagaster necrorhizus TaxID=856835 RepID=A0A9P7W2D9_9AGAR|nr:uncharacterized protein BT62DRAFT_1002443 [Guyanagaster necrorhizus MCA 3950]KAG7450101.1 hypothetical protein BT62DRAFT_1002443 [Guyanagaster necrorhizus MCA 3950]